ncbi:MAG TPA: hypothetical protein VEA69_10505 [Tepidisphaeraceae bacterium]|nr:hypothetical protein [Tepidisphaeraceae bacterium]
MADEPVNSPAPPVPREVLAAIGAALAAMAATHAPPAVGTVVPELLERRQAAELLNLSLTAFTDLESRGYVGPAPLRLGDSGRIVRFSLEELRAWIRAGCPSRAMWNAQKSAARRSA